MFNPAMVYDMIGEIYSVLICLTYLVTILLYMKVSLDLLAGSNAMLPLGLSINT